MITEKQNDLLVFIKSYSASHGFQPSIKEMKKHMGVKWLNSITSMLVTMEKSKLIKRIGRRAIKILGE